MYNFLTKNLRQLLSFIFGGICVLAFSPFGLWWIAFLSIAGFYFLINRTTSIKQAFILSFCYGFGLFSFGVHWVFVSINTYGNTGTPLALILTFLWLLALTVCFFSWLGPLFVKLAKFRHNALLFACLWVFVEWVRSWLFTGFPWLYIGYTQTNSFLSSWGTIGGAWLISFFVVFISCFAVDSYIHKIDKRFILNLCVSLVIIVLPYFLSQIQWTKHQQNVTVALLQGNVDQNTKWVGENIDKQLSMYARMIFNNLDKDLIILPETALPLYKHTLAKYLKIIDEAAQNKSSVIAGLLTKDGNKTYNSITALGISSGDYNKVHLVPFGEFIPFHGYLQDFFNFFNIPMSHLQSGMKDQSLIKFKEYSLANFICYEIAYADYVNENAKDSNVLITISNDAWFGTSIGPHQHMQIAQMRAIENNKQLLRATNTGITAIVNEKGEITNKLPQDVEDILIDSISLKSGETFFNKFHNYPLFSFIFIVLLFNIRSSFSKRNINLLGCKTNKH